MPAESRAFARSGAAAVDMSDISVSAPAEGAAAAAPSSAASSRVAPAAAAHDDDDGIVDIPLIGRVALSSIPMRREVSVDAAPRAGAQLPALRSHNPPPAPSVRSSTSPTTWTRSCRASAASPRSASASRT